MSAADNPSNPQEPGDPEGRRPSSSRRGPGRPALARTERLSRDEIVSRALELVRDNGLDALSMRRLANELGVTPMAIYHHLPDKPALLYAMIERVWAEILKGVPRLPDDPLTFIVAFSVRTREVWLENFELANFAVAVAEADDTLFASTRAVARAFEAAGFPDVPLAYSAVQNFTMGCIQVMANRRTGSAYFGRDPDAVLDQARRLFARHDATANQRGILEARFDAGDEAHFEPALRALIAGLLGGR